jgi:hypothetical protein
VDASIRFQRTPRKLAGQIDVNRRSSKGTINRQNENGGSNAFQGNCWIGIRRLLMSILSYYMVAEFA